MSGLQTGENDAGAIANANPANSANPERTQLAALAGLALATTQKRKTPAAHKQDISLADIVKAYSGVPKATPPPLGRQRDTTALAKRWQWFLSLATEHGIHPDVVGAEFPSEGDKLDVIEPAIYSDDSLRKCMSVHCSDPRVQQRQWEFIRREEEKCHVVC